jgi:hypothetical protein
MDTVSRLVEHIRSLPSFRIVDEIGSPYGHMGATLADAALQAGVRYETVVRARVQRLLREHPHANTTSAFSALLRERGAKEVLTWNGRKLETLDQLIAFLLHEQIETEPQLAAWINQPGNLDRLRGIKGIKDKTANYIKILVGGQSVAVDRHLFRFLAEAGAPTSDYSVAHATIGKAAERLGVEPAVLDHSIWRYMSERSAAESGAAGDVRPGVFPE